MQRLVALLLVVSAMILRVAGQSCEPLTNPTCSQWIPLGTPIFVPPDSTLHELETITNQLINVVFALGTRDPCLAIGNQLNCLGYLRPCQVIPGTNETIPFPQQPCLDLCEAYYNPCGIEQASYGQPAGAGLYFPPGYQAPLNCSMPMWDKWALNTSFYAANETLYTIDGQNYTLPCSDTVISSSTTLVCQSPLIVTIDPVAIQGSNNPTCGFACPLPSLTDSQYDHAKLMQGIVGWFSWAGTFILCIVMLLNPLTRSFPRNLILLTSVAANIAAGAIILPTMAGYENTWCGGGATLVPSFHVEYYGTTTYGLPGLSIDISDSTLSFSSSLCSFQGAVLQFGFLAAVFWWVVIAFNMCFEVYLGSVLSLENKWWKWGRFAAYNIIVWGLAFLLMVIPASAGEIKFLPGATYCFVTTDDNYAWELTFWFIPVGVSLLIGLALFILALVKVTILLSNIAKWKTLIFLYLRLSVFIFSYFVLFIFIVAYNIQVANDSGSIHDGYEAYYLCLVEGNTDCSLDSSVSNYNLVMLRGFSISALGIALFVIFVASKEAFDFYWHFVKTVYLALFVEKQPRMLLDAFKMVVYASSTRSISKGSELTISNEELPEEEELEEREEEEDDKKEEEKSSSSSDD